jgi:DnaD/phage-associated family protein
MFKGFPEGKTRLTPLPGAFFHELLPQIEHLGELKITLFAFWLLDHLEGTFRYLRRAHFLQDADFMRGMGLTPQAAEAALDEALERCVRRGTLLRASLTLSNGKEDFYFLNSPKGRAAVQALHNEEWRPSGDGVAPLEIGAEPPNAFRLYEEHIGPLTPMIAEALQEAEQTYPARWIEEAFRIAVENNVRNWRYIQAILRRWQEKGRYERTQDRRDTEKDRRRYAEWENPD